MSEKQKGSRLLEAATACLDLARAAPDAASRLQLAHELSQELDELAEEARALRLEALVELRDQKVSYDQIARIGGMHKQRVAQLARSAQRGSRPSQKD